MGDNDNIQQLQLNAAGGNVELTQFTVSSSSGNATSSIQAANVNIDGDMNFKGSSTLNMETLNVENMTLENTVFQNSFNMYGSLTVHNIGAGGIFNDVLSFQNPENNAGITVQNITNSLNFFKYDPTINGVVDTSPKLLMKVDYDRESINIPVNVGIGKSDPRVELDVIGTIYVGNSDDVVNNNNDSTERTYGPLKLDGNGLSNNNWKLNFTHDELQFEYVGIAGYHGAGGYRGIRGYVEDDTTINYRMNDFTGSHRCSQYSNLYDEKHIGLIVVSTGKYETYNNNKLERGNNAITMYDSLPIVELSNKSYQKNVFGVIGSLEKDYKDSIRKTGNTFKSGSFWEKGNQRIEINGVGEGAIWVSNYNGILENGDYIASSNLLGYGMKQEDDLLHNYTVAKITCDCDFIKKQIIKKVVKKEMKSITKYKNIDDENDIIELDQYNHIENNDIYTEITVDELVNVLDEHGNIQWVQTYEYEDEFQYRYLLSDGTQISEEDYNTKKSNGESVYMACLVGCSYHCS
jgi:hypothetical protein